MGTKPTAEQIYGGMLRGPLTTKATSASNAWAGQFTMSSGSVTYTVSTTNVGTDSLIFTQMVSADGSDVASAVAGRVPLEVKSVTNGEHILFGTSDSSVIPRDTKYNWLIFKTS